MAEAKTSFICAGGNRIPLASDWSRSKEGSILAYGAGRCIALWDPQDENYRGVTRLLKGHHAKVNTVHFLDSCSESTIASGAADGAILLWRKDASGAYRNAASITNAHSGSINSISSVQRSKFEWILASGSADGTIGIWTIAKTESFGLQVQRKQTFTTKPKYYPLVLALGRLPVEEEGVEPKDVLLAVGGSTSIIQVWGAASGENMEFALKANLVGHENWVRTLAFRNDPKSNKDVLLASGSQDRYIRLWRFHQGSSILSAHAEASETSGFGRNLSNKAHKFSIGSDEYTASFEALLIGHEDWIYTVSWNPSEKVQLLSASADNSIAIWEEDAESGIWLCATRLGDISAAKGATTATGSSGGLWSGHWSTDGKKVVALGRTGSWRQWQYSSASGIWHATVGITGHSRDVTGISWGPGGNFLLSTSLDQTSRLFAKWNKEGGKNSWHEFARPQIHGYDINCISCLGESRFISGADEKLLRVFEEPKPVATYLEKLCGIQNSGRGDLADVASQPVLGLSNKAVSAEEFEADQTLESSLQNINHPPLEETLSRQTLYPEIEKLYGHGHEISALDISKCNSVAATACKASSIDHAVIRLFETTSWRELKPPLRAHELTVTKLSFSPDSKYLLSVGRDRKWAVFEKVDGPEGYKAHAENGKAHTRIIWDGKWAPLKTGRVFATASRDKSVKIWRQTSTQPSNWESIATIKFSEPVTAIDFAPPSQVERDSEHLYLAAGLESGNISIHRASIEDLTGWEIILDVPTELTPDLSITELAWNPIGGPSDFEMAASSSDSSLRIYQVRLI